MGRAKFYVNLDLFQELLHLPGGTVVNFVHMEPEDYLNDRVQIIVTNVDLPESPPGTQLPIASPCFERDESQGIRLTKWNVS